ncbi:MAG: tRNA pseudouridine(55) synthase TruB, partial [Sedimentibacter sp.]
CELILGQSTDTQDSYGKMVEKRDNIHVNYEDLTKILKEFEGKQLQVPPAYSAVKLNGKKLYEYARQNIIVEKPGKTVDIKELKLLKFEGERVLMQVKCSKGTYMRTLCNDIGERLGTLGYMGVLIRTEAKGLRIENSITLEQLKFSKDNNKLHECLIPVDKVYPLERINVDDIYYDRLTAGNEVSANINILTSDEFYIYCKNQLVGIGKKVQENTIKVEKMLM